MTAQNSLCISYIDESKILNTEQTRSIDKYTIVSVTANRDDYIQVIEPKWKVLRVKHGIPNGQVIHFTDIRHLLVPGKSIETYKSEWLEIFSKTNSPVSTDIDYEKIHNFFCDVVNFIEFNSFVIHATGIRYDRQGIIRNISNNYFRKATYQPPYYAFREHLNLMALYLMNLDTGNFQHSKFRSTKLRYDGDLGLGEKADLREAFNHCIALGTRHFRPTFIKEIFDEIRFINKDEVGGPTEISHAGNEITDFITTIISRYIWGVTKNISVTVPGLEEIQTLPAILPKLNKFQRLDDNFV